MPPITYVRAPIDTSTKERAVEALEAMGLFVLDAIRLLMPRISDERLRFFDVKARSAARHSPSSLCEPMRTKRSFNSRQHLR